MVLLEVLVEKVYEDLEVVFDLVNYVYKEVIEEIMVIVDTEINFKVEKD